MHATRKLQFGDDLVPIDNALIPLILELWAAGYPSKFSCQGSPEFGDKCCGDLAYIAFPHGYAKKFFELLWYLDLYCQLERWERFSVVRFDHSDIDEIFEALERT